MVFFYQKNYGKNGVLQESLKKYYLIVLKNLLSEIKIENPSRRVQAFKSIHWAQRWANPNLNIFSSNDCELFAPYYENAMCEFICSIPNNYLNDRKIQIKYIQNSSS